MRKLFLTTIMIFAAFAAANAQQAGTQPVTPDDFARLARAPQQINGIGRMVLNVVDEDGNPVKDAQALLESNRTDGFFCESWAGTNALGYAVLPPIHMGRLKLKIKAKGYQKQEIEVPLQDLSRPVTIKLARKR